MWYFRDIFAFAMSKLTGMAINPGQKVALAREFDISNWLESALTELALRDSPPSLQESQYIGMKTAVTIFHLREERWKGMKITSNNKRSSDGVRSFPPVDVKSKFTAEIRLMDRGYNGFMAAAPGSEETSPALWPRAAMEVRGPEFSD